MCVFSWAFWLEFLFVSLSSNEHSCRGKIRQVSSMLLRISLVFFSSFFHRQPAARLAESTRADDKGRQHGGSGKATFDEDCEGLDEWA